MRIFIPYDQVSGVGNDIKSKTNAYGNSISGILNAMQSASNEVPPALQHIIPNFVARLSNDCIGIPVMAWLITAQELLSTAQQAHDAEIALTGTLNQE